MALGAQIINALVLQGFWDANSNLPDITGTTQTGYTWIISVAGGTNLGGISDWQVGDMAVKIPGGWTKIAAALPAAIVLQGDWDADTNTPDITGTTTVGFAWLVSVDGSTNLGGITTWVVGDIAVKSATGWIKIDNTTGTAIWGSIQGTLDNQVDLKAALDLKSNLIYNGIDTEANILVMSATTFLGETWWASDTMRAFKAITNIAAANAWQCVTLQYDAATDTFEAPETQDGHIQDMGQEVFFIAFNDNGSGATVLNPKVFSGTGSKVGEEQFQTALKVVAGDLVEGSVYGINTTAFAVGDHGKIVTYGQVSGVNTSAWSLNDILYVDPTTNGEITNVQPGINAFIIGRVLKSDATTGIIFVSSINSNRVDVAQIAIGFSNVHLTGQTTVTGAGTFYEALVEDEGTVGTATEAVVVPDNSVVGASQDHLTQIAPAAAPIQAGLREGIIEFSVNAAGGEEKIYLEAYDADGDGVVIDSGILTEPIGDLGVRPILTYETSLLDSDSGTVYKETLRGELTEDFTLASGNRLRLHFLCEKIGTAGGSKTFTLNFGSDHDSLIRSITDETFDRLSDTPNSKVGQALKSVRVNAAESELEYYDALDKATYDPTNKNADAFNMENMVEGATKKILTTTERTNIGNNTTAVGNLGTAANANTGTGASNVPTISQADARYLVESNNLSDLPNKSTARSNLQLGTAAQATVGVGSSSQVPDRGDADARYLLESNNLSDLTNDGTARTNLDVYSKSEVDGLAGKGVTSQATRSTTGTWNITGLTIGEPLIVGVDPVNGDTQCLVNIQVISGSTIGLGNTAARYWQLGSGGSDENRKGLSFTLVPTSTTVSLNVVSLVSVTNLIAYQ